MKQMLGYVLLFTLILVAAIVVPVELFGSDTGISVSMGLIMLMAFLAIVFFFVRFVRWVWRKS